MVVVFRDIDGGGGVIWVVMVFSDMGGGGVQ